ncbi:hypothetical protein [Flavobacterium capsici]|uniref:Uncharacterized protein n=1 Tax=Flavobacterium capsici TaxID=3075618 RepID=A0AA96J469_9FLAO|nr:MULTISPECIES: hypothetical protein [unclassified Flavobacterium]WNM20188.1 hypothetical protein RN608_05785 [Flavobacterium sp. PMR2A8]WNM21578.1 hypothetical protein RN605_12955 [Flavobacterium sp. PMTSA4]
MEKLYNPLLILLFLSIGICFIYNTYKKPDYFYSQNVKGYVAGFLFILMGLLSMFGKFSILEILRELF